IEYGIRAGHVTGVQTCALPIKRAQQGVEPLRALESTEEQGGAGVSIRRWLPRVAEELRRRAVLHGMDAIRRKPIGSPDQIATVVDRKSACRERGESGRGGRAGA